MSYIKLDRKIAEWEWFTDGNTLKLWIYLLVNAQYKDTKYKGIEVKRGQIITGRKRLANRLGMTEQQIRTSLNHLEKTKEITIKSTNRFSVITIAKYGIYQGDDGEHNQQHNQQSTNNQPTDNHNTRNIRRKEGKNIYNSIPIYDPSSNKTMTAEEEKELLSLMKGEA